MKAKKVYLGAFLLAFLSVRLGNAQDAIQYPRDFDAAPKTGLSSTGILAPRTESAAEEAAENMRQAPNLKPSDWVLGSCPDCCGPANGWVTINSELFTRIGPSFILDDGDLNNQMENGWRIEGGGRVLFTDPSKQRSWAVELGLGNTFNRVEFGPLLTLTNVSASNSSDTFTSLGVRPRSINRTYLHMGLGREWYHDGQLPMLDQLMGCMSGGCGYGCGGQWRLRYGVDAGGRWGQEKAQLDVITAVGNSNPTSIPPRHIDEVIGAVYVAGHVDLEYCCASCTFYTGVRVQYDHTWSDIFQTGNDADIDELLFLVNAGVRY